MSATPDLSMKASAHDVSSTLQSDTSNVTFGNALVAAKRRVSWCDREKWVWPKGEKGLLTSFDDVSAISSGVMPYVRNRSLALQAGGACGIFPKYLSKLFEYVYTFEPNPDLFKCLIANCDEDNVFKFQAALTNGLDHGVSIVCGNEKYRDNRGAWYTNKGGPIPTLQIDEIGLPDVGLIYLDIEGAEHEALVGGEQTIYAMRPVIVVEDKESTRRGRELWIPNWIDKMGYEIAETFKRDVVLVPK